MYFVYYFATSTAARRFAKEVVAPRVQAMDKAAQIDPDIIKGLFEQGFMG